MMEKAKTVELRKVFKLKLLENPDYFGNLSAAGLAPIGPAPVVEIVSDTYYEELTCLSYNPETEELCAIVKVKQTTGYLGGPCTNGSKEYVRFYLDYHHAGAWQDVGVVNFDAHDLPFPDDLSYAVRLVITPKFKACCDDAPVLPRVRAILSWNEEPPANQPGWAPVWGNVREADIQIAPSTALVCLLKKKLQDLEIAVDPSKLKALASAVPIEEVAIPAQPTPLSLLKRQYADEVGDNRLLYPMAQAALNASAVAPLSALVKVADISDVAIAEVIKFVEISKFDTYYEEVKCVGLDRDWSVLHASIQVKRPCGYSGSLCTPGSLEYVAFYMDFGSGWEYMGTTSVRVHDIPGIPAGGLWYNAALPVSLTAHQKAWCQTGMAKVRAILSWDVLPTPGDPDYVAPWGDWEQACVEVRPLPKGVVPGKLLPVIESLGGMPVALINASGYANGVNPVGLTGIDSPFDGSIEVLGIVANAPDSSLLGVLPVRYRIMVKEPSKSGFQASLREFTVYKTEVSGGILIPQVAVTQSPNSDGWMNYLPDFYAPDIVSIDRNLLAVFVPAEGGLHSLYVEIFDPNTALSAVSQTVNFMVDKTAPQVDIEITSGGGNCGVFKKGDKIKGTFSYQALHGYQLALSVTPSAEAHGAVPIITGTAGLSGLVYKAGLTLPATTGKWELDTGSMDPCGYNVRIFGEDRIIVDSRWFGREAWDIEGFCLAPKEGYSGCC